MKKLFAILMAGAMMFSLAACGGDKGNTETTQPVSPVPSIAPVETQPPADSPVDTTQPDDTPAGGGTETTPVDEVSPSPAE